MKLGYTRMTHITRSMTKIKINFVDTSSLPTVTCSCQKNVPNPYEIGTYSYDPEEPLNLTSNTLCIVGLDNIQPIVNTPLSVLSPGNIPCQPLLSLSSPLFPSLVSLSSLLSSCLNYYHPVLTVITDITIITVITAITTVITMHITNVAQPTGYHHCDHQWYHCFHHCYHHWCHCYHCYHYYHHCYHNAYNQYDIPTIITFAFDLRRSSRWHILW